LPKALNNDINNNNNNNNKLLLLLLASKLDKKPAAAETADHTAYNALINQYLDTNTPPCS